MSRARVAVLKVASGQLSVTAAAVEHGFSRRHLHRLLSAYRAGGLEALEPRSRAPKTSPHTTPEIVRTRVIELRQLLSAEGLDAGPVTIGWHLEQEALRVPSTSTIRRILHQAGLITPSRANAPAPPTPASKPPNPTRPGSRTSCTAGSPTEPTWRSSAGSMTTHATCSSCTAHQPVTGTPSWPPSSTRSTLTAPRASTLTDNGRVYTARFGGGRNAFEYLLPMLGVRQKNGSPGHPQTQGKIERFHQTLQRWLAARPAATSLTELQRTLDSSASITTKSAPTER